MFKFILSTLVMLSPILLTACDLNLVERQNWLQKPLLVWHPLRGREAEVFTESIQQYIALYPEVSITLEYIPTGELANRFLSDVQLGLGPDLLLSNYFNAPQLITSGMVQDLARYQIDTSIYHPPTINQVTFQDQLYGIPYAIDTQALCYNKNQINNPPRTLNNLLRAALVGQRVALTGTFQDTFWGLSAFESQLSNSQDALRLLLDQNATTQWLTWLQKAKDAPSFVLNTDRQILHQAFAEGEFDYYICLSYEIPALQTSLGADNLGVVPLPARPDHPAGPFMRTSVLLFSQAASPDNTDRALQLAQFLTNVRQQTEMTLETESQIPVNTEVRLDNRLTPTVAALLTQSKTAVAIPLADVIQAEQSTEDIESPEEPVSSFGEQLMQQVIAGETEPSEAAAEFAQQIQRVFSPNRLK